MVGGGVETGTSTGDIPQGVEQNIDRPESNNDATEITTSALQNGKLPFISLPP